MDITTLCSSVKKSLPFLKGARTGKAIDHSFVEKFQESIKDLLNKANTGYVWDTEQKISGRTERDSIDILGVSTTKSKRITKSDSIDIMDLLTIKPKWIIEIDATRSDQVSQKMLSRLALCGLKAPIIYVAILYPDTQGGKNACEKYLRYGNALFKAINPKSNIFGIFVDPSNGSIEVLDFQKPSHFEVNGKECESMNEAAEEVIKVYLKKHPVSYAKLVKIWGKYVNNIKGPSRYKNIGIKTTDGVSVFTYTQFRQYGLCSYWSEFERLAKKNKIAVTKMRRMYVGLPAKNPFTYVV